jgi:hypothetical protein
MKKVIALMLVLALMVCLFAGCKGNDTDNNSDISSVLTSDESETGSKTESIKDESSKEESTVNSATKPSKDASSDNTSGNTTTSSSNNSSGSSSSNKNSKPSSSSTKPSSSSTKPSSSSSNTSSDESEVKKMPEALKTLRGIEKYETQPVDYSNASNWIARPTTVTKDVDVFFLYPTGFQGGTQDLSDINDATMVAHANVSKAGQASVFAQSCNIYMPKYRQLAVSALLRYGNEENMIYCASFDLYSALDYYFENCNNGRPFIIAGHSQGSVWASVILQDYMKKHPEYLKRMVAAYVIGYSITKDYLKRNPHLKFATGAKDTGVIISYNTEGVGNKNANNMVVEKGAVAINPINWKKDDTYASKEENLGSLNIDGEIEKNLADAKIDLERGVVVCETADSAVYAIPEAAHALFGPESYHGQDYGFYYMNLRENAKVRIEAFKNK